MKNLNKYIAKLTLFDRIIAILTVFGILFVAYYFLRKPHYINAVVKVNEETVKFSIWKKDAGTSVWFEQYFREGMKEVNGLGQTVAQVNSIYSYDTGPSRRALYLNTKLNAVYNRATGQYTFKGRPLIVGSTIKLNLDKAYVEGLVTYVEGLTDTREKVRLRIESQLVENNPVFEESEGVRKSIADVLNVGTEVKDSQGNGILKILEKRVEDAKRLVTTSDGRIVVALNPLRKDVYLVIEANAYKLDNKYFLFDDVPVLIGQTIPFNTPEVSVLPEVTKITLLPE